MDEVRLKRNFAIVYIVCVMALVALSVMITMIASDIYHVLWHLMFKGKGLDPFDYDGIDKRRPPRFKFWLIRLRHSYRIWGWSCYRNITWRP